MWLHFSSAVSKSLESLRVYPEPFCTTKNRLAYMMTTNKAMKSHYFGPFFFFSSVNWPKENAYKLHLPVLFLPPWKTLFKIFVKRFWTPLSCCMDGHWASFGELIERLNELKALFYFCEQVRMLQTTHTLLAF